jgi:hypothetical protein
MVGHSFLEIELKPPEKVFGDRLSCFKALLAMPGVPLEPVAELAPDAVHRPFLDDEDGGCSDGLVSFDGRAGPQLILGAGFQHERSISRVSAHV